MNNIGLWIFIGFIGLILVFTFFPWLLIQVSKLYQIANLTYKKSLIINLVNAVFTDAVSYALYFLGRNIMMTVISAALSIITLSIIYHLFTKINFKRSLYISLTFNLILIVLSFLLSLFNTSSR